MLRERVIRWLGGYASTTEAIEAIRAIPNGEERRRILTLAVRRLYNSITGEDVLKPDPASGQWTFMGKPISKEDTALLTQQAKNLLDSQLWRVLQTDLKYQANKRMFTESVDVLDITAGKMLVFYTDIIHTRLKKLAGR